MKTDNWTQTVQTKQDQDQLQKGGYISHKPQSLPTWVFVAVTMQDPSWLVWKKPVWTQTGPEQKVYRQESTLLRQNTMW